MDKPIDIVLSTWNRWELTKRCIRSLYANTTTPFRLIIIDNGSSREMQRWLASQGQIVALLDRNYGLECAKNLGMNFVESEMFISTDNDILASKPVNGEDWLSRLIKLMENNPKYGAITCRPQVLVGTGNIFKEGDITDFDHVPGYLRIMRTQLVKDTGAWNEKLPLRGHEEFWIGKALNDLGWKTGWANNIRCYHMFGEENWGYDPSLLPEQHGHNEIGGLPRDSQFDLKEYE